MDLAMILESLPQRDGDGGENLMHMCAVQSHFHLGGL